MGTNYVVHNTVRGRHNRTLRALAPVHHALRQNLGGRYRVLRGRPLSLTEEQFLLHLEEIKAKAKLGAIEVRTSAGALVDLDTLQAVEQTFVVPPLPNFPLDSAENDKAAGQIIPKYAGGDAAQEAEDPNKVPSLVSSAAEEEEVSDAGEETILGENTEVMPTRPSSSPKRGKHR